MFSIKKYIPNALTCCNLLSGCVATSFAYNGDIKAAFLFIILGAVFDFFDGMAARLLHVSSPIGKELDSLADNITFGVAPSMMVYFELGQLNCPVFLEPLKTFLPYIAFLIAAFSALRLAKFNIDERQSKSFIGLPTPANALFWGGLLMLQSNYKGTPALNKFCLYFIGIAALILLILSLPAFAIIITWYVILSIIRKK